MLLTLILLTKPLALTLKSVLILDIGPGLLITLLLSYIYQMGLFYLSEKILNTFRICSEMLCWIWEPIYEKCQWWILPILQCQVRNQQECRLWYVQTCTLIPGSRRLIFWRSHFEKSEKWILKFPWALWVQMSSLEFSRILWVQMSSWVPLSSVGSNEFPRVPVAQMGSFFFIHINPYPC